MGEPMRPAGADARSLRGTSFSRLFNTAGVYAIAVWVENTGYLPFPTAMGRKNQHVPPAILTLAGKDLTFLQGRSRTPITSVDGLRGVKLEWVVQAPTTLAGIDVVVESANAGGDTGRIALGSAQGGVK